MSSALTSSTTLAEGSRPVSIATLDNQQGLMVPAHSRISPSPTNVQKFRTS
ncbi:hypothetical protein HGRIS_001112 [Hohenbuehelia grisea]|uniref:Uncharacterized protein n=1 Tax=Hohenbuehelia grisea TaxID=104357 RepID=A0ABR3JPB6_9AGAR